jgi:hypothetical protein
VKHATLDSETERARLHERLSAMMHSCGTRPDEIRWPDVEDYQPATHLADVDEGDESA